MTDTQLRFLRAIAAQVPVDRVTEVHLFPALRQGGVETGVAVIAVEPLSAVAPIESDPIEGDSIESELIESESIESDLMESDPTESALIESEPIESTPVESDLIEAAPVEDEAVAVLAPTPVIVRHIVYSARYRHTLKGPERGKWESDVHAEADAPLITVEVVVRGVRERAGEAMDPDRMSGDEFRAAISGGDAWTIGRK